MKFSFLALLFVFMWAPLTWAQGNPIQLIEDRMAEEILATFQKDVQEQAGKVPKWVKEVTKKGYWGDLDYKTQSGVSWGPTLHLGRIRTLAAFHQTPNQPFYDDPDLVVAIQKGLDYFVTENFQSYNWWFNEIGVPINAGQTLIMMREALKTERKAYSKFFMNRKMDFKSGQNFAWLAQIWLYRGAIENDPAPIGAAVKAIEGELIMKHRLGYNQDEGIFPDFTFIQHQWVFYNLGYGLYFSDTITQFVKFLLDTPYQLSKSSLDQLLNYVAVGQLSMIRNNTLDYSGTGRYYVRPNAEDASLMVKVCQRLANVESEYKTLFETCAAGIEAKNFSQNLNRMFWNGDYMVHQRAGFMLSVKMHSERLVNSDQPSNGEGLRSTHMSDGATFIYQTGAEYKDIFPLWDFRRVPGTTALPLSWPKVAYTGNFDYREVFSWSVNPNSFVGGVSDGKNGLATMEITKDRVHEKKSYFFNDQGMVVVGSELQCTGDCQGLRSSINQEWLKGEVTIGQDESRSTLPAGEGLNEKATWVHHANTAYLFPDGPIVSVAGKEQSGAINKISAQLPGKTSKGDVFNLSIAREESSAQSYVYAVHPGVSADEAAAHAINPGFKILSRSPYLHALKSGEDLIQASFFRAGTLSFENEWIKDLTVKSSMAVQITGCQDNFKVFVSDPTHKLEEGMITVILASGQELSAKITFPQRGNAGQSVEVTFPAI